MPFMPEMSIKCICHDDRTQITFLRDADDRVMILNARSGFACTCIMDGKTETELVLRFIAEFPSCVRCIPLRVRRRKAIKAAIILSRLGVNGEKEKT